MLDTLILDPSSLPIVAEPDPRRPAIIRSVPLDVIDDPAELADAVATSNRRLRFGSMVPVYIPPAAGASPIIAGSVLRFMAAESKGRPVIAATIAVDRSRLPLDGLHWRDTRYTRRSGAVRSVALLPTPPIRYRPRKSAAMRRGS